MKRAFAFLLALAMVFSLGVTAFAEETGSTEKTGSITITNTTIGETYAVYKIFDATIKLSADGKTTEGVSYSIVKENNKIFTDIFGDGEEAKSDYFVYNPNTGTVTKKEGANDADLIKHLTKLVEDGNYKPEKDAVTADSHKVEFTGLPYGYYVITSSLGATVTINSNTPSVSVIDKNQEPAPDFDKQVQTGADADGNVTGWGDSNSANIGDGFKYRISFTATNYDGDKQIKHYQIHDEKGDAIWAEFNSFSVKLLHPETKEVIQTLKRGYYLSQGGTNTGNWGFLGDWSGVEQNRNNAEWYLVHLGKDQFRVTIPWLKDHQLVDVKDTSGNVVSYKLTYPENPESKYASPVQVEVIYDVIVEYNAAIGGTTHGNRFNKANASWTSEHETGSTPPDEVVTHVYGIGLLKDDTSTGLNLAGAKFRIYRDKECTSDPVYVIPTGIDGVYIVDSYGSDAAASEDREDGRELSRVKYAAYVDEYLNGEVQDNYVVSQVNGKLAILGLAAGKYYLKEVEAPSGYNALTQPVEIEAGVGTRPFNIFVDETTGKVADIQQTDGVHTEKIYDLTHTVVHNSKGVELPSTGGAGKMMLLTFGSMIAMAFAVLMITQKKMSIYKD